MKNPFSHQKKSAKELAEEAEERVAENEAEAAEKVHKTIEEIEAEKEEKRFRREERKFLKEQAAKRKRFERWIAPLLLLLTLLMSFLVLLTHAHTI